MPVAYALIKPLYMAMQSVMCGDTAAPRGANFDHFVQALQVLGFTPRVVAQPQVVLLDPPTGFNQEAGPLQLVRPNAGQLWYSFEHAEVAHALEERYGLTGSSFIELPGDLLPGINGFVIAAGGGL